MPRFCSRNSVRTWEFSKSESVWIESFWSSDCSCPFSLRDFVFFKDALEIYKGCLFCPNWAEFRYFDVDFLRRFLWRGDTFIGEMAFLSEGRDI